MQFEERPRKVHLHHDQKGALIPHSNRPFVNTLCKMNSDVPSSHITDDPAAVTCKICLRDARFPGNKGRKMARKPIIAGSREHYDVARAPLLKQIEEKDAQIADLCATIDTLKKEAEEASEWRMDIRAQVKQADDVNKHLKATLDRELEGSNALRRLLHESELDRERMRGYLDALEDSRPPRMVEEKKERHFGRYTQMSSHEAMARDGMWRSNGERPKAWFER